MGMKMFIFFPGVYVSCGVTELKLCERKGSIELEKNSRRTINSLCVIYARIN